MPATQNHITTCFDVLENRRFCSFPYRHRERQKKNKSIETRHAGASKRVFHSRHPQLLTQNQCFLQGVREFSSHVKKEPRLPRNQHLVTTSRSPHGDSRKTNHKACPKYCACHAKWQWRSPKCCACHENCNSSSENDAKIALATQNNFRHITKHV